MLRHVVRAAAKAGRKVGRRRIGRSMSEIGKVARG
jgi:hypothetical protein